MSKWTTSVDLSPEWRALCRFLQGYDNPREPTSSRNTPSSLMQGMSVISLIPEYSEAPRRSCAGADAWTRTVQALEQNMDRTMRWIEDKKIDFISVQMPDDEAYLIQSTVTSFTAATANEIDALRSHLQQQSTSSQRQQHRNAVVQTLLDRLKHIAVVFSKLQKQRHRKAVQLWQNPLLCELVHNAPDDQRFFPTQPRLKLHSSFMDDYLNDGDDYVMDERRWPFPHNFRKRSATNMTPATSPTAASPLSKRSKGIMVKPSTPTVAAPAQDLQQEAILLQATLVESDLDAVQKMEQQMVDITTLLAQFSDLVAEQQEEVLEILDSAVASKHNMDKGQEHLAEATQRSKANRHYMAGTITIMGMILLFFHWVTP